MPAHSALLDTSHRSQLDSHSARHDSHIRHLGVGNIMLHSGRSSRLPIRARTDRRSTDRSTDSGAVANRDACSTDANADADTYSDPSRNSEIYGDSDSSGDGVSNSNTRDKYSNSNAGVTCSNA